MIENKYSDGFILEIDVAERILEATKTNKILRVDSISGFSNELSHYLKVGLVLEKNSGWESNLHLELILRKLKNSPGWSRATVYQMYSSVDILSYRYEDDPLLLDAVISSGTQLGSDETVPQ